MTRLFLAAGVAAMAIASAAVAKPGGGNGGGGNPHDGGGGPPAAQPGGGGDGGGGGHGRGNGGGGGGGPVFMGGGHGHGGGGGFAAPQVQRMERPQFRQQQVQRMERPQFRAPEMRAQRHEFRAPQIQRMERQQARNVERQQMRGFERQQARNVERQQMRGLERQQARNVERQQMRGLDRQQIRQADTAFAQRDRAFDRVQQIAANNRFDQRNAEAFRNAQTAYIGNGARGLIDGCPPGLWMKNNGCMPPGQAAKLLGAPLSAASALVPLSVLPQPLSYLYPDTSDYYWRYGDGYMYQVDRGSQLINALMPLIGGGYVPGQYLPQPYMASYVPDYYGWNSFYPDYGDTCNRYANGVIYEVDCQSGYIEDVIPMYAGGYGVGQMLPSAYNYYNVPMQYRSMYYDTPDYGYWYAPGAIYQYDQGTNLITSVAALMSPGFTVGQQLPLGYDVYNVPYDYRATYYDTPNAWYRYNNGYIYQVDPTTQIITAIVASLLT